MSHQQAQARVVRGFEDVKPHSKPALLPVGIAQVVATSTGFYYIVPGVNKL